MHLRKRLLAVMIIAVFAFLFYINWHQLNTDGTYYPKLAAFGPVGIVVGIFLLAFPTKAGKPRTTADRVIVILVFLIGLALGLVNWYLMDPKVFGH